jgi:hypothetical protein
VPDNSAWVVDTDYTVEFWCNATSFPGQYNNIFNQRSSGTQYWGVNWDTSLGWAFFWNNGSGETKISRNQNSPLNTWVHFAFVKSGTTGYIFLNGVQAGATFTIGTISDFASLLYIGVWPTISDYFNGYISNFRMVKGTAVYTSSFTPPSGALAPIANTVLLTCRYPTIVDGSTNAFTITNTGSVAVSNVNPFPTSQLPNPALGGAGNGVYTMSQYAALKAANLWPAFDPYYKNVTLNLHGNAGAVLPFNTDASTNNFQVTQVGDTRPSNYTPFIANGYWSNLFTGTSNSNYLSIPRILDSTVDITLECWIYMTSTAPANGAYIAAQYVAAGADRTVFIVSSGVLALQIGSTFVSGTIAISVGSWNHVAFVRSGNGTNNWSIYVNGVRDGQMTYTGTYQNTPFTIGATNNLASTQFPGYISNLRLLKGTALYSGASFTPPTAPLTAITNTSLLTCQSNRVIDNSASPNTITVNGTVSVDPLQPFTAPTGTSAYGSGYFDGSGDYLRAPTGYLTGVTTGNFTVEGWWNFGDFTVRTTYFQRLWSFGTGLANDVTLNVDTSGNLVFRVNDSIIASQSSGAMKLNSWNHVALVRSSGTVTIYLNGTSVASAANSSNISGQAGNPFYIGCESDGAGGYFYGYCSNVRITNTAVYTTTFTPSTTPLTAVSGTSLLTVQTNAPSQNNTFLDSSTNNFVITRNGNTTQGTFTPYGSNWSNYFNGSSALYFRQASSAVPTPFTFLNGSTGTGTFECWVYVASSSQGANVYDMPPIVAVGNTYMSCGVTTTNKLRFYWWTGSPNSLDSTATVSFNTWTHVAFVRNSATITLFVNGVSSGSISYTGWSWASGSDGDVLYLGYTAPSGSARWFNGYISNVRIVNGTALYTSDFTPSTAPLTAITNTQFLTCQSNRFVDNSSSAYTLTVVSSPSVQRFSPFSSTSAYSTSVIGGSGYFDGSDYLDVAQNPAFGFGTGDFSLEVWNYGTNISVNNIMFDTRLSAGTGAGIVMGAFSTGSVFIAITGLADKVSNTGIVKQNTWNHYLATRSGSTLRIFINGVLQGYFTGISNDLGSSNPLRIGYQQDNANYAYGYITEIRLIKGSIPTSYQTSATSTGTVVFTPSTSPLTLTSQGASSPSFLGSMTNAGVLDNAMMNDLETVGNAQISTSVKKYGTGSMYFDGTGDYLLAKSNDVFNFGTGDFTVEFWINASASGSYTQVIGTIVSSNEAGTWRIGNRFNSLNQIYFARGTGSGFNEFQASVNVNDGNWHHVAVVRYSGTVTIYADGIASASSSITGTCTSANPLYVGYNGRDNAYITGYLDDIRITKGVARYTGNFTPPTSQVQDQ